ncbi:UNVERIFIED_CONTAM: protein ENHANCED DISEASE RESISTANCE 2-like [Sesamum angustifolium]|uniref:Protein ENHANCED DISEASE RESISTANCE 2-like n=1 Tax=Sesamum angustifolium TaxID=2727405 RepID=A0AAW2M967_9LAMI
MNLVAIDWFKDTKRMDHVARRSGCAAQVASDRGYFSIVFNLQATATEELPERLIGSVQISHIELSSAIVPVMETDSSS